VARPLSVFLKSTVCLLALLALAFVTRSWWLAALGRLLVRDQGPARAEIAVVLAGDFYGHRILRSAELVKQGYVPAVLVSGPNDAYGLDECDLEIPFAMKHGCSRSWFIPAPNQSRSTREEAAAIVPELRRRGVHHFLLVTSDYHTARAARIYHAVAPDLDFRVVAAPDEYFSPDAWWHTREGQKTFLIEWLKTGATFLGM